MSIITKLEQLEQLAASLKQELATEALITTPNSQTAHQASAAPSSSGAIAAQTNNLLPSKIPFSFEFFPVKTDDGQAKLLQTFAELNALNPAYFSVTYGAGGSTRERTLGIVDALRAQSPTPIAPHLSCIGDDKAKIGDLLDYYKSLGIKHLVALRGDLPSGMVGLGELPFAADLVRYIRAHSGDHFTIKVAAYPEMHPQARSFGDDIARLAEKYHAGANLAITQFFYNADSYLYLRDALAKQGITQDQFPIVAGIMPITNASNLIRFADSSGADVPRFIRKQLQQYGDDKKAIYEFGLEAVTQLCARLISEGVPALHFYTMNKVCPNKQILQNLGLVAS